VKRGTLKVRLWAVGSAVGVATLALTGWSTSTRAPQPSSPSSLFADYFAGDSVAAGQLQLVATGCGYERWPVKTVADYDRASVDLTHTVHTSISWLRARAKPGSYPQSHRINGIERTTFWVPAWLTQYKLEADGDIHLVLKDSGGRSIIGEIPAGFCLATISRVRSAVGATRAAFARTHPLSTSWHYVHQTIYVRGVGFFDPPHGQTGAAPNGFELHPIIGIGYPN
jgi:hypothetical protein